MLLSHNDRQCSLSTTVSLAFAASSLFLFVCNWLNFSPNLVLAELALTSLVLYRSTTAIRQEEDRLLNGLALLITAIPAVFFLLVLLLSMITGSSII